MRYSEICKATFLSRPNRFVAYVSLNGETVKVHVKNTGRCRELLVPGSTVILERSSNPERSTGYDLVSVYKGDILINMDSQAPNKVAFESLEKVLGPLDRIVPEYKIGDSRIDLYAESGDRRILVEVKGVTLEDRGVCRFPDAPTERGAKHIRELVKAKEEGYETYILFVIQMKGVGYFEPNDVTDPVFGSELRTAKKKGVGILAYDCIVTEDSLTLDSKVEIRL